MKVIDSPARSMRVLLRASSSVIVDDLGNNRDNKVGWAQTAPQNDVISEKVASAVAKRAQKAADRQLKYVAAHEFLNNNDKPIALFRHADIVLGTKLGHGGFSDIYSIAKFRNVASRNNTTREAFPLKEPHNYCIKVIRSDMDNVKKLKTAAQDLMTESLIMATLNHKNVLALCGWSSMGVKGYQSGRHDGFFIVLERIKTTLGEKLPEWQLRSARARHFLIGSKDRRNALVAERMRVSSELSQALNYLHQRQIIHRDVKPENVGLNADGTVKLFDFGLARTLPRSTTHGDGDDDDGHDETFQLTPCSGSAYYMAPEVALKERYNCKADVYSFVVLLYEIVAARPPFGVLLSQEDLFRRVHHQHFRPSVPRHCSPRIREVLRRGWSPDMHLRPTMEQIEQELALELQAKGECASVKPRSLLHRPDKRRSFPSAMSSQ